MSINGVNLGSTVSILRETDKSSTMRGDVTGKYKETYLFVPGKDLGSGIDGYAVKATPVSTKGNGIFEIKDAKGSSFEIMA